MWWMKCPKPLKHFAPLLTVQQRANVTVQINTFLSKKLTRVQVKASEKAHTENNVKGQEKFHLERIIILFSQ